MAHFQVFFLNNTYRYIMLGIWKRDLPHNILQKENVLLWRALHACMYATHAVCVATLQRETERQQHFGDMHNGVFCGCFAPFLSHSAPECCCSFVQSDNVCIVCCWVVVVVVIYIMFSLRMVGWLSDECWRYILSVGWRIFNVI